MTDRAVEHFATRIMPLEFSTEYVRITFAVDDADGAHAVVSVIATPAAFQEMSRKIGSLYGRPLQ